MIATGQMPSKLQISNQTKIQCNFNLLSCCCQKCLPTILPSVLRVAQISLFWESHRKKKFKCTVKVLKILTTNIDMLEFKAVEFLAGDKTGVTICNFKQSHLIEEGNVIELNEMQINDKQKIVQFTNKSTIQRSKQQFESIGLFTLSRKADKVLQDLFQTNNLNLVFQDYREQLSNDQPAKFGSQPQLLQLTQKEQKLQQLLITTEKRNKAIVQIIQTKRKLKDKRIKLKDPFLNFKKFFYSRSCHQKCSDDHRKLNIKKLFHQKISWCQLSSWINDFNRRDNKVWDQLLKNIISQTNTPLKELLIKFDDEKQKEKMNLSELTKEENATVLQAFHQLIQGNLQNMTCHQLFFILQALAKKTNLQLSVQLWNVTQRMKQTYFPNQPNLVNLIIDNVIKSSSLNKQLVEPLFLWERYKDKQGKTSYSMKPYYADLFAQILNLIPQLKQTVNKKWNKDQVDAYQQYLIDVENYITEYILTGQVVDLNLFYDALEEYGVQTNPLGNQLYKNQIDYLQKVEEGYDFRLDKKKKKAQQKKPFSAKNQTSSKKNEKQIIINKKDLDTKLQNSMKIKQVQKIESSKKQVSKVNLYRFGMSLVVSLPVRISDIITISQARTKNNVTFSCIVKVLLILQKYKFKGEDCIIMLVGDCTGAAICRFRQNPVIQVGKVVELTRMQFFEYKKWELQGSGLIGYSKSSQIRVLPVRISGIGQYRMSTGAKDEMLEKRDQIDKVLSDPNKQKQELIPGPIEINPFLFSKLGKHSIEYDQIEFLNVQQAQELDLAHYQDDEMDQFDSDSQFDSEYEEEGQDKAQEYEENDEQEHEKYKYGQDESQDQQFSSKPSSNPKPRQQEKHKKVQTKIESQLGSIEIKNLPSNFDQQTKFNHTEIKFESHIQSSMSIKPKVFSKLQEQEVELILQNKGKYLNMKIKQAKSLIHPSLIYIIQKSEIPLDESFALVDYISSLPVQTIINCLQTPKNIKKHFKEYMANKSKNSLIQLKKK